MNEYVPTIVDTEAESTELATSRTTPFDLIQQAMKQDWDVDRLGKLLDMQREWRADQAKRAYTEAMNRCQKEMPIVVREKENSQTNSKYAPLEAVAIAIRPVYTREGFTLEFGEEDSPLENHRRIVCDVMHVGGHSTKKHLDSPIDNMGPKGVANKTSVQGLGSLVTYLRRYLTLMIFNITVADSDTDGNPENSFISDDAIATLNEMLLKCREVGNPVEGIRLINFLKAVGVKNANADSTIADITHDKFLQSVQLLTKAIAAGAKKTEASA